MSLESERIVVAGSGSALDSTHSELERMGHDSQRLLEFPTADALASAPPALLVVRCVPGDRSAELKVALNGMAEEVPILAVVDREDLEALMRTPERGFDDYVTTPVSALELTFRTFELLSRRRRQQALTSANEKLKELHNKKKVLASLVVHDMRNPLSALRGNVELLSEELGEQSEFVTEVLQDVRALTQTALSLTASLLDVEELEEGLLECEYTDISVSECIQRATATHWPTINARGMSLEVGIDPELTAKLDVDMMGRLIENLLDNAVRYAPRKGRVVIKGQLDEGDLILRVGNNGPPVPESERAQIFDRYYRIEARRAGARANRGLGLYFCRLVAEAHGGRLWVEETDELPACFVVRIPQEPQADE